MTLLAPIMLALAAAAAVPMAIHFLRRRSGTRVVFPATRYVQRAEREHSRELKLRNLIVMLLRVTALVLVALAAARPFGGVGEEGYKRTALALFIDNSMSSGAVHDGTQLLDRLKHAAVSAVSQLKPGDRAWLISADGRVVGGSNEAIVSAISRLEALPVRPDNAAILETARAAAGSLPESNPVVGVLTDAQQSQWTEQIDMGGAAVRLFVPRVGEIGNRQVLEARPVPPRWSPRGAVEVRITGADAAAFVASLSDGSVIRGTTQGGASRAMRVRFQPRGRGWVRGSVALERDELAADDVRHFAVWVGDLPRARVDASAGTFAGAAVAALVAGGRIMPGGGTTIAAADAAGALPAILAPPTDPIRIGAANRRLARLGVPWRFGVRRNEAGTVRADSSVLRGTVSVSSRYELLPQGTAEQRALALATVAGDPWLVAGDRYALFASPFDPTWTTLPVGPAFVPLLESLLAETLSPGARAHIHATPGTRVTLPAWVESVEGPSRERARREGWVPAEPGVYYLLDGRDTAGVVVANVPQAESDLRKHSTTRLAALFPRAKVAAFETPADWRAGLFPARAGRPLAAPMLSAALLLLLAEMVARSGVTFRRP